MENLSGESWVRGGSVFTVKALTSPVVSLKIHHHFQLLFHSFHTAAAGLDSSWRCTHHGVGVSSPLQVVAALSVGVGADTQTIGGVELLHQEWTTGLNHRWQLEQAGGWQQRLDGVLPQLKTAWNTKRGDGEEGMAILINKQLWYFI